MCNGACCNDFATNPEMQLVYVAGAVVYAVATIGVAFISMMEDNVQVLEWIFGLMGLGVFILWIMMLTSRCCSPCCCKEEMPDVPAPCPPGPMTCQNPKVLDYPIMIGVGGDLVTSFLVDFIVISTASSFEDLEMLKYTRLVSLVWAIPMGIGACTGYAKYKMLKEQRSMRPPATMTVGTPTATPQATVVGTPVPGKVVA